MTEVGTDPRGQAGTAVPRRAAPRHAAQTGVIDLLNRRLDPLLLGVAVAVALGLWISRRTWGPGPPAGFDVMGHLIRADVGVDHLLARGQIDGWNPRFILGSQMYLIYGPGFYWFVAAIRGLTLGLLSTPGAVKVAAVGSFVALPVGVAFLARSLGLDRFVAGVAAVLALGISSRFGVGLEGLFGNGLMVNQFAALLLCVALGALVRTVEDERLRWVVVGAVATAWLAVTHLPSIVIVAILLGLFVVVRLVTTPQVRSAIPWLAATAAAGILLAGFWAIPLAGHRNLHGPITEWERPGLARRVMEVLGADMLLHPRAVIMVVVGLAVVLGAAVAGWHRGWILLALPIGYLVIAHLLSDRGDWTVPLVNRGLGYVGVLAVLAPAAVLGFLGARYGAGGVVAAMAVAVFFAFPPGRLTAMATEFPEAAPEMHAAADQLRRLVPEVARFTVEIDFPDEMARTGVPHPGTWLAHRSGRNVLMSIFTELSPSIAGFERDQLGQKPAEESAHAFARFGVTHLVTTSSGMRGFVSRSQRFLPVWEDPPLAIFAVRPPEGQPASASLLTGAGPGLVAQLHGEDPEHPRWAVDAPAEMDVAVAISWSPKWTARLDGRPVPLARTEDSMLSLTVPPGRHDLALDFAADGWDLAGRIVSLATIAVGAATLVWFRRERRRRREAIPPGPTDG